MSTKLYTVALSLDQRKELARLVKTGARKAFTRQRAQIWLRVDQGPQGLAESDVAAAGRPVGQSPHRGAGPPGVGAARPGAGAADPAPGSCAQPAPPGWGGLGGTGQPGLWAGPGWPGVLDSAVAG